MTINSLSLWQVSSLSPSQQLHPFARPRVVWAIIILDPHQIEHLVNASARAQTGNLSRLLFIQVQSTDPNSLPLDKLDEILVYGEAVGSFYFKCLPAIITMLNHILKAGIGLQRSSL